MQYIEPAQTLVDATVSQHISNPIKETTMICTGCGHEMRRIDVRMDGSRYKCCNLGCALSNRIIDHDMAGNRIVRDSVTTTGTGAVITFRPGFCTVRMPQRMAMALVSIFDAGENENDVQRGIDALHAEISECEPANAPIILEANK